MTLYNVSVTQYSKFYEIEADSEEAAKEIATVGYIWNDCPNYWVALDVETSEEED
tara:strand:- start:261 stop:425 length:165 start_codon:yes stop_codon:yes gene_type:complete